MITTLFFMQLIGFYLWYVTSKQVRHINSPVYLSNFLNYPKGYRMTGLALLVLSTILFVVKWGWMSGVCAGIVGLMGVGSLVVLLSPLRYISEKGTFMFYLFFIILEFFI